MAFTTMASAAKAFRLVSKIAITAASIGAASLGHAQTGSAGNCASLSGMQVQDGVVVAAERFAQGSSVLGNINPASLLFGGDSIVVASTNLCRVKIQLRPTTSSLINVEIWLPDAWNGKMFGYGGGGLSGGLGSNSAIMNTSAGRGYASVTSDLGHDANPLAIWAWNQPEKIVDWGHRSNHLMTLVAKKLMNDYYGNPVQRAYFQGCSGGGREAMMEVTRYPEDYDGVIAGAPAMRFGGIMSQQVWASQIYTAAFTLPGKLPAVANAVLRACDGLDGVNDGLIENPRQCSFDPASIKCGFFDTGSCLNDGEIAALNKLYQGPRLSSGDQVLPGFSKGGEAGWFQAFLIGLLGGGPEYYKWLVYNDPLWTPLGFKLDVDVPMSRMRVEPIGNSDNPDIRAFTGRGGKLIMYHGWSDEIIPAESSARYYEAASSLAGPPLSDSARLFMIPGAKHCQVGFDIVPQLEAWVENGQAPNSVINHAEYDNGTKITRLLCPWPQTAVYNGVGPTGDAASFTCRGPNLKTY